MSSFLDPLDIRDLGDRTFQLLTKFRYHLGTEDSDESIVIPAGFITDFASIPRFLWAVYPPYGRYGKAAVVHDGLYKSKGFRGRFSRKESDKIFLEAMHVSSVDLATCRILYRGVRVGGWWEWHKPIQSKMERMFQDIKESGVTRRDILESPKPVYNDFRLSN